MGRSGDISRLSIIGEELGFEVLPLTGKLPEGDHAISSTRCRQSVEAGDVALAARMLGRPFALAGEVVPGRQLGRTIGVPTINLGPKERKLIPPHGVYAIRAYWVGNEAGKPAVLNIGVRPTVSGVGRSIEFHVLDENVRQAPLEARVEFVARLREEIKFAGLEALKEAISGDIVAARRVL